MFHIAIHFALRVSELVTIQLHDFKASHDPRMKAFQNFGTLTITENDATGTIPMREPEIYELLMWYLSSIRQKSSSAGKILGTGYVATMTKSMRLSTSCSPSAVASSTPTLSELALTAWRSKPAHAPQADTAYSQAYRLHEYGLLSRGSAEIYATQNLYTTLGYYHPAPLDAANEANALDLFSSFLMMRTDKK